MSSEDRSQRTGSQPMCGTFNPRASRAVTSPGTSPSPSAPPRSVDRSNRSCRPRQMPSTGVPALTRSATRTSSSSSRTLCMAAGKAPTPGRMRPSAARAASGSLVTSASSAHPLERLLDRAQVPHAVVEDRDRSHALSMQARATAGRCASGSRLGEGSLGGGDARTRPDRSRPPRAGPVANALKQASIMWCALEPYRVPRCSVSFALVATARKNSSASSASKPAIETGRQVGLEQAQRAAGDVDRAHRERLVHRDRHVAVAADPGPVAERAVERLPEGDADVLDGVVRAGLEVPVASTPRPSRPCRPRSSSMWSRNPTPVEVDTAPPSRSTATVTSVSRVLRWISAVRLIGVVKLPANRASSRIRSRLAPQPTRRARESPPRRRAAATYGARAVAADGGMVTTDVRRRKVPGPSGPPKRAAPPVGSTWLEPAA